MVGFTMQGRIWAQWVHGVNAGSTVQTVTVNPNSRWVTAYASIVARTIIHPGHSHGAFGAGVPPSLDFARAGISEFHWHDGDGDIQQVVAQRIYLAGGLVTKIKFEVRNCSAVLVINYWE